MLIGYVRISKSDDSQTLAPQRDALLAAGVADERIYQDLAFGRHDARPGLQACLKALQPGNTLVLWKLDRLGRDLRHLVTTAEDLRLRGVGLKVLAGTSRSSGQVRPAALARARLSCTVERAIPSVRPISRELTPSWANRSICLICRMVSCLLAGIPLSSWSRTGMPRLLTRGDAPSPISATGWPASSRNGGRHQIGTLAGFASEWVAGFRWNPQRFTAGASRLSKAGVFERLAHSLTLADRERAGRGASPTGGILDAQAARSGGVGVKGERGYDPARRVVWRKRHALTDSGAAGYRLAEIRQERDQAVVFGPGVER